jgi:hypothetical protein
MLANHRFHQHTVLGAGGTAARRLIGERVAHAIGDPLAPDLFDRLHHVDVMAEDEVDLGRAQQLPRHA